jgi:hypothetical protein
VDIASIMKDIFYPGIRIFGIIVLVLLLGILPVSASFVFQNVVLNPSATPLYPGQKQSASARLVIIPQGGTTTFIESNQLQLSTQLNEAQWNVQVMVNGVPAAKIPANGNTVFINGFLLSYPLTSDVTVSVEVNGMVPNSGGPGITLIEAVQLNNAGQVVPGSTQTITGSFTATGTTSLPVTTSPVTTEKPSAAPTTTPGFTLFAGIAGFSTSLFLLNKAVGRK